MFQLTTSRRGRPCIVPAVLAHIRFNSRPHEEVDLDGVCIFSVINHVSTHDLTKRSTHCSKHSSNIGGVSTHDLTKRSTTLFVQAVHGILFQLTTSRRGRHADDEGKKIPKEFQLTTSRRGRLILMSFLQSHKRFNSRPHEEVDDLQVMF